MRRSVRPPTTPARRPSSTPMAAAIAVATTPMTSESRAATAIRASRSRPSPSVPSGCAHDPPNSTGGMRRVVKLCSVGEFVTSSGPRSASARKAPSGSKLTQRVAARQFTRVLLSWLGLAFSAGDCCPGDPLRQTRRSATIAWSPYRNAKPRVEGGSEDVDEQAGESHERGNDDDEGVDDGDVPLGRGLEGELTHAGPGKDGLDDDRATDQETDLHANIGERGQDSVRQDVPNPDGAVRQTFARRDAGIMLPAGDKEFGAQ